MALSVGTRLGPYEILAPLGAGGMGEVYRAKDTRLDRTVAIKVLSDRLSNHPELKERFDREARTISSISHPNICALYDVGHQDGVDYLVMEFLEGQTLAEKLQKGALPTDQVIRYGIQIAGAVDKAHRNGIVHRDLKPGNIMITRSGVKLLDFGLAKLQASGTQVLRSDVSALPTEQRDLTAEGTIIGTLQYMSPEQLEGSDTDTRTDIFAIGVVLYEMATGRKAFSGKSQASLISAILSSEPPAISTIQPMTPPALVRVVKTCLAKDPEDRWQTAHDVMLELNGIAEDSALDGRPVKTGAISSRVAMIASFFGAAIFLLSGWYLHSLYSRKNPLTSNAPVRLTMTAPKDTSFEGGLALSPDGLSLAFVASEKGKRHLWLRDLSKAQPEQIQGSDGATFPFWSPDSEQIGFFAKQKLYKVSRSGGAPQILAIALDGRGGAWNRDGIIIYSPDAYSPLYRISQSGGNREQVTRLNSQKEDSHRWPYFLPDQNHFLFYGHMPLGYKGKIFVGSLDSSQTMEIMEAPSRPVFALPGYLLTVRNEALMAQTFDIQDFKLHGEAKLVDQPISVIGPEGPTGFAPFSTSDSGNLVYAGSARAETQLTWVDRSGRQLETVGSPGLYDELSASPDGLRLAFNFDLKDVRTRNIWLMDLQRKTLTRFTFSPGDGSPIWSPDGSQIAFSSARTGHIMLFLAPFNAVGKEKQLYKGPESAADFYPCDWSHDGRFLLLDGQSRETLEDIWILPMQDNAKAVPLLKTSFNETQAQISPDGRWIAYASDETGRLEIYVQSFPGLGMKQQVSIDGGEQPAWRKDGAELYYISSDRNLMAVAVQNSSSALKLDSPQPLFAAALLTNRIGYNRQYIVSNDGKKFLLNVTLQDNSATTLNFILNWTSGLKR